MSGGRWVSRSASKRSGCLQAKAIKDRRLVARRNCLLRISPTTPKTPTQFSRPGRSPRSFSIDQREIACLPHPAANLWGIRTPLRHSPRSSGKTYVMAPACLFAHSPR